MVIGNLTKVVYILTKREGGKEPIQDKIRKQKLLVITFFVVYVHKTTFILSSFQMPSNHMHV